MPTGVCSEQAPQAIQEVVQGVQHAPQEVLKGPPVPQEAPQAPQLPLEAVQIPAVPVFAFSSAAEQTTLAALPGRVNHPPRRNIRKPIKKVTNPATPETLFDESEADPVQEAIDNSVPQFALIPEGIVSATGGFRLEGDPVPAQVPTAVVQAAAEPFPPPERRHRLPVHRQKQLDRKSALLAAASADVADAPPAAPAAPAAAQVALPGPSTAPAHQFTVQTAGGEQEELDYGDDSDIEWFQQQLDGMHADETAAPAPDTLAAPVKLYGMNSELAAQSRAEFEKASMRVLAVNHDTQAEKPNEAKEVERASSEVMAGRKTLSVRRNKQ